MRIALLLPVDFFLRGWGSSRCAALRGPAAIVFISRDTCSDSIAKLLGAGFCFRENQTCTKLWLPFRVAFAPLFPKGNLPFSGTGKRPVSLGNPTISTESLV